jgi:hypothetical protein
MLKKLIVLGSVCLLPACAVTTYDSPYAAPVSTVYVPRPVYVPPPVVYVPPVYSYRPYHRPYYHRHW